MKVGLRMTVAASAVVTLTVALYAAVDLHSSSVEREAALRNRTEDLALAVRLHLETLGTKSAIRDRTARSAELTGSVPAFAIAIWPQSVAAAETDEETRKRVATIVAGRLSYLLTQTNDQLIYSLPLRTAVPTAMDGFEILGVLEVSAPKDELEAAFAADLRRKGILLIGIVATVFTAILLLSRTFVTNPIAKLLTGVDEVAHGDLTRVVLAEREDEIGDLAARFNEMTFSLRESRSETDRHNQERAAIEQRLFQTEKLATIGQLSAEIAHEVGTPLNVIAQRARTMEKKAHDEVLVAKNARIIAEQSDRITRIIQRLLDYSRRKVGAEGPELVNLNAMVFKAMEFLDTKLSHAGIKHRLTRAEGLPMIRGNPDQVLQVLMNLVLNAAEAMPDGGRLTVETDVVSRRRPGLEIAPEQSMVVVTVSDSGHGIAEEERDRIFEPFYSSKTHDGGTGLGLSVVHGIVKDHDGWIEVSTPPEGGTKFSVYFPISDS